jgi:YkoY family integral membrane protein
LAQAFNRPILGGFGAGGFPQGAGQQATLLVGRDLHHPRAWFGMHQTGLQLHRASRGQGSIPRVQPSQGVMEAESIQSLSPLIQGVEHWGELLLLLPLLVALEVVLSADNAIALAAISRSLHDRARQEVALNLGLLLALVFRLGLIAAAQWVLHFWPLQLAASCYLLWLCGSHLWALAKPEVVPGAESQDAAGTKLHPQVSLARVVATLAVTDLAFSLDSVAAAVAVSDRLPLVMIGGVIGVICLRLTAELFIRWLEIYRYLETAGYVAVGLVGIRLLLRLLLPELVVPEWALLLSVVLIFAWGFSARLTLADRAPEAE